MCNFAGLQISVAIYQSLRFAVVECVFCAVDMMEKTKLL